MNTRQAINRIGWRFGGNENKYPFPVNEQDIEAFNQISDEFEAKQKQQFSNNEAFAKLYILVYAKMIEHYKTSVFDHEPRKAVIKLLERPLPEIIEDVRRRLNDSERYSLIESIQGKIKHPVTVSDNERQKNTEKIKEALKSDENVNILINDVWDFETVSDCLISEVNHAINILNQ